MKHELNITSVLIDDEHEFSLYELSTTCQIDENTIVEMVEHGLLTPSGQAQKDWVFSANDLKRSQKALRLQQDLDVNMPGAALAIELLEELETLRDQITQLRQLHR